VGPGFTDSLRSAAMKSSRTEPFVVINAITNNSSANSSIASWSRNENPVAKNTDVSSWPSTVPASIARVVAVNKLPALLI
jgi:hypothetical protein